jgi:hypothetical protein
LKAPPPRFAADVMLGKAAKWLRMLGFDTFYDNKAGDDALKQLCHQENRILLTRDTLLQQSLPPESSYLVVQNFPRQQLAEISGIFELAKFKLQPRCTVCNGELVAIEKIQIREKVPPYVFHTQSNFSKCLQCQRIYWPGTHLVKIVKFIETIGKFSD